MDTSRYAIGHQRGCNVVFLRVGGSLLAGVFLVGEAVLMICPDCKQKMRYMNQLIFEPYYKCPVCGVEFDEEDE